MKGRVEHAILLVEIEGKWYQRPLRDEEKPFVLGVMAEFDGGVMKVAPMPGDITIGKVGDLIK